MSATDAVAAVYGLLRTVSGLGPNVYDQIRFAKDDAAFNAVFVDRVTNPAHPAVHAWMVTWEGSTAGDDFMQAMSRTHSVVMVGYRSFQDGVTDSIWQAEVESIASVFAPYAGRQFAGKFDWSGPPKVENVKLVFLGNVLCHTARIVHQVREFPIP